jgi:hypothetical protein
MEVASTVSRETTATTLQEESREAADSRGATHTAAVAASSGQRSREFESQKTLKIVPDIL